MIKFFTVAATLLVVTEIACNPAIAQDGKVLSQPGGRFAFGQISSARVDQYMLDTATGRLWQLNCLQGNDTKKEKGKNNTIGIGDCASYGLVQVPYVTIGSNNQLQYDLTPASVRVK